MSSIKSFLYAGIFLSLVLFAIACANNYNLPAAPPNPSTPTPTYTIFVPPTSTPTITNTPCGWPIATCTPTFTNTSTKTFTLTNTGTSTFTPTKTNTPTITNTPTNTWTPTNTLTKTNTPNITATFTPTTSVTVTIPMGLWIVAAYTSSISDMALLGIGTPITQVLTLVDISINHTAETTDAVTLNTPGGAVPVTYTTSFTMGGIPVAEYGTTQQYAYVVNGTYSINAITSLGTVSATQQAPGGITFNANGASVTATYPGTYDAANVAEYLPAYANTYASPTGVNIGSPFTYPVTAYNASPATFMTSYTASTTITSFTGPAAVGSAFVGSETLSKYFAR